MDLIAILACDYSSRRLIRLVTPFLSAGHPCDSSSLVSSQRREERLVVHFLRIEDWLRDAGTIVRVSSVVLVWTSPLENCCTSSDHLGSPMFAIENPGTSRDP